MRIGEVCLLTNDVPRLAAFYKRLLGAVNMSFYDPDNNMVFFRSFPQE